MESRPSRAVVTARSSTHGTRSRAVKQAQQSLEFAAVVGGGVELEGKSASIKSISECIQPELHAMLALAGNSIEGDFGAGFGIACHCTAPGRVGLESWTVPRIMPMCAG